MKDEPVARYKVAQVGGYEGEYREEARQTLAEQNFSAREQAVQELFAGHVARFAENRPAEPESRLAVYRERLWGARMRLDG